MEAGVGRRVEGRENERGRQEGDRREGREEEEGIGDGGQGGSRGQRGPKPPGTTARVWGRAEKWFWLTRP